MNKLLLTDEPFLTGKPLAVWLDNMKIDDWSINDRGLVDVKGCANLHERLGKLTRLPVRFGTVGGDFYCGHNQLVSLEGAPEQVGGCFNCHENQLVSLEGAPKKVGGDFHCYGNQLVSLKGGPKKVDGYFDCENNQLVSLEGAPKKVGGHFRCKYNQLVSLEGGPKKVDGHFDCDYNQLVSLAGAPEQVGECFECNNNQLVSLEGAPKKVGGGFYCSHNFLVDFKGMEGVSMAGVLSVTDPHEAGQDNVFVSLAGLPKEFYSKVVGLDIQAMQELGKKRAASLLSEAVEVEELISEVELG